MAACPRCARPLAVPGPRCLYCGSDLSGIAAAPVPPAPALPPPARTLVVLELHGSPPEALAAALGLSPLEAVRRAEHGGFHLHRIAAPRDAETEARRLAATGLVAWLIPEAEMLETGRPRLVRGGGWEAGALVLEVDGETLHIGAPDVLLVVRGPIVRQYQPGPGLKRLRTATLEDGYRFHVHLIAEGPPLELDPGDFAFAPRAAAYGSSRLVISGWLDELRALAPLDDDFRRQPPALGPESISRGALGMVEALRPSPVRGASERLALDNVAQFRAHSALRALVERRRRAPPSATAG
jgi:hypothetical protein